ncbi:head decoration protein [Roseibium alexandrii]|uniref:head decoration protein n=1 Tax=Roseibium alexandrii TaxID=388408 RepID=UPI0037505500
MPTVLTEGRHPGEFIMTEANGQRSRESVTIPASQSFEPNTVLARLGSAGSYTYVPFNQDGVDGSEAAFCVAIYGAETGAAETVDITAIVRDAEVNGNCLAWPSDIEAAEIDAAVVQLNANGIIVR